MDTPRSVFKIDKNSPGSDVAGETAAALAAASLVFRRSDPTYSKLLARRAIRVKLLFFKKKAMYSSLHCSKIPQKIEICCLLSNRYFSLLISTEDPTAMD